MEFVQNLFTTLGLFFSAIVLGAHAMLSALSGEVAFYAPTITPVPTSIQQTATSTSLPSPTATPSPSLPRTTTKATTTVKVIQTVSVTPAKTTAPKISITPPPTPSPTASTPAPTTQLPTSEVNVNTRASLVNILCTTRAGGSIEPISGSGVIVDTRGIILTNAHVAQFFLLRNYPSKDNIDCLIRTGNPATARYRATLLYLPPAWVTANAPQIIAKTPVGTGENDYAFLYITSTVDPSQTLPASFPAIAMTRDEPNTGDRMVLAAYPAGFLDGITIANNLYMTSAVATVAELYTFEDPKIVDVFSIGGTVVSQGGASGGAAVRTSDGKLTGIITTNTASSTTAGRDLRAITLAHIQRSLIAAGKGGVIGLLSQDPATASAAFATDVAPAETKKLTDTLNKR